mmetsp:Transcript_15573/g.24209  ORF Transcript_15573/g.24209 Transcript_15573/m.24209 type:complete len:599 (+) Transcript_15573:127-1923(+)|eukprot:CAMPEP_0196803966 /NCGR_PEP_ID=MMETSP1362-20130617/3467_1 /TAXON_ID=163516 /ORGANISM="Leptocylindrus danicus, Strain CCMP1856" /LENGTH=598 /DNA_ID=CAMNT_0042175905 /DNA_START=127 /DNA_END=1923 /DNA_ORIENTATION=-
MSNFIEPEDSPLHGNTPPVSNDEIRHVPFVTTANIAQQQSNTKCRNGSDRPLFPVKLHNFLSDICTENQDKEAYDAIRWSPNGLSFKIHHMYNFETNILPKYFNLNQLRSFYRQLNLYGFKRITNREDSGCYEHPHFIRGNMKLCEEMRRQKIKGTGSKRKKGSDDGDEPPDFYSMPSLPPSKMANITGSIPPRFASGAGADAAAPNKGSYLRNIMRPAETTSALNVNHQPLMSAANPMGNVLSNPGATTAAQLMFLNAQQQQTPWAAAANFGAAQHQPSIQQLQLEIAKRDMLLNIQRHQMLNMVHATTTTTNPAFAALGQFDQGLPIHAHNPVAMAAAQQSQHGMNMYGNYGASTMDHMAAPATQSNARTCCRNARGCPCCNSKKSMQQQQKQDMKEMTNTTTSSAVAPQDCNNVAVPQARRGSSMSSPGAASFCDVLEPNPVHVNNVFESSNSNANATGAQAGYSSATTMPQQFQQQQQQRGGIDDPQSNTTNSSSLYAAGFFADDCDAYSLNGEAFDNNKRRTSSIDISAIRSLRNDSISELSLFGGAQAELDSSSFSQSFGGAGRRDSGGACSFFGAVREVEELLEADELFPC